MRKIVKSRLQPRKWTEYCCTPGVDYQANPELREILLKEQGILIYETFAIGNEAFGRPTNPDFLLQPGELLQQFLSDSVGSRKNHCIAYEHGQVSRPKPAMVQRICLRSILPDSAMDRFSHHLD